MPDERPSWRGAPELICERVVTIEFAIVVSEDASDQLISAAVIPTAQASRFGRQSDDQFHDLSSPGRLSTHELKQGNIPIIRERNTSDGHTWHSRVLASTRFPSPFHSCYKRLAIHAPCDNKILTPCLLGTQLSVIVMSTLHGDPWVMESTSPPPTASSYRHEFGFHANSRLV